MGGVNRQAQALVQQARAGLYPTIGANLNATRARAAGNTQSFYTLGLPVDWEVDLWGMIRRQVEASEASAQASAADLESTRLSLQAQLAPMQQISVTGIDPLAGGRRVLYTPRTQACAREPVSAAIGFSTRRICTSSLLSPT